MNEISRTQLKRLPKEITPCWQNGPNIAEGAVARGRVQPSLSSTDALNGVKVSQLASAGTHIDSQGQTGTQKNRALWGSAGRHAVSAPPN